MSKTKKRQTPPVSHGERQKKLAAEALASRREQRIAALKAQADGAYLDAGVCLRRGDYVGAARYLATAANAANLVVANRPR